MIVSASQSQLAQCVCGVCVCVWIQSEASLDVSVRGCSGLESAVSGVSGGTVLESVCSSQLSMCLFPPCYLGRC